MNITVIGTGYVGLVTGACLADVGNNVTCVDIDDEKIEKLRQGIIPFYEPGLKPKVDENLSQGRLRFASSLADVIDESFIFFIAVGTPPGEDGSADLSYVLDVADQIGRSISRYSLVVTKSTVPVGTAERVRDAVSRELDARGVKVEFDVVSNPEFLKEGAAVEDFMKPDRIIIGCSSDRAYKVMHEIYAPFTRSHERFIHMPERAAEMTKYAANSMLATKISFMNEIAELCDRLGVDVEHVRAGIGSDSRIGYSFIYPGCGFGGSCFPKDIRALLRMAEENGMEPSLLRSVQKRNELQKNVLFEKVRTHFDGNLKGLKFGLWGLSFKPGTDDMREAPSRVVIESLVSAGAKVKAYDPAAMDNARKELPKEWFEKGAVELVDQQYEVLNDADALILVTEWKPFRHPDFDRIKALMKTPVIFDGRNQYDPASLRDMGFHYEGIGR